MLNARTHLFSIGMVLWIGLLASSQDKKAPATIKLLIPEPPTQTVLKVDGKELDQDKSDKGGVRVVITPGLEPGKTHVFKIEAKIVPNNYTEIFRTREIRLTAGGQLTLDLRKMDAKIKDDVQVRWVPTPEAVVRDMCELAKINKDDVVMDPGCGDAIMIITAVRDYKAKKGLGNDLDPMKVLESQENVARAGLKERVIIKQGNALHLTADETKDVTVLMLYMGNDLNILLRPLIWEHMKPGTRVVSHRFIMDDWKPDRTIKVTHEDEFDEELENFTLHLWKVTGKEKNGDYPKIDPETIDE